jgi:ABC-type sugar transport system permease subunit
MENTKKQSFMEIIKAPKTKKILSIIANTILWLFVAFSLFITILVSFRLLPKRPAKYRKGRSLLMILQWILMPVVSILYQSIAAYYAQTRLMLGLYMEKFDVTKKVVKK